MGDYNPYTHVRFSGWKHSIVHAGHWIHLNHTFSQIYEIQICPVTKDQAVLGALCIVWQIWGQARIPSREGPPTWASKPTAHRTKWGLFAPFIIMPQNSWGKSRISPRTNSAMSRSKSRPHQLLQGMAARTRKELSEGSLYCPLTDEWIKKMWYIYTMEYYSAIKKNELMPFTATWMDLEMTILSKVSQTEKDKYQMISIICGI